MTEPGAVKVPPGSPPTFPRNPFSSNGEFVLNTAERLTGLDLDGDGDVGVAGHDNRAQPLRAG